MNKHKTFPRDDKRNQGCETSCVHGRQEPPLPAAPGCVGSAVSGGRGASSTLRRAWKRPCSLCLKSVQEEPYFNGNDFATWRTRFKQNLQQRLHHLFSGVLKCAKMLAQHMKERNWVNVNVSKPQVHRNHALRLRFPVVTNNQIQAWEEPSTSPACQQLTTHHRGRQRCSALNFTAPIIRATGTAFCRSLGLQGLCISHKLNYNSVPTGILILNFSFSKRSSKLLSYSKYVILPNTYNPLQSFFFIS